MMDLTLREIPQFPPPWAFASAGRRDERQGRLAARRAFVELKLVYMRAAATVGGELGQQLQKLVRQAGEPIELWLLRTTLLAAMSSDGNDDLNPQREALCQALAEAFDEAATDWQATSRW